MILVCTPSSRRPLRLEDRRLRDPAARVKKVGWLVRTACAGRCRRSMTSLLTIHVVALKTWQSANMSSMVCEGVLRAGHAPRAEKRKPISSVQWASTQPSLGAWGSGRAVHGFWLPSLKRCEISPLAPAGARARGPDDDHRGEKARKGGER
ncbi:hypothetical protein DM02DRAFT_163800 [Periconia macrospinosa]|uniref:Uncharacterized protein n=1 Tax=Periconia macrospinosa TaxID=97972 RepID=A0A2V1DB11_9PLEO|nr:hypothetical protein DM02DRAFT_163800 [Periconia macrospinosa]